ncbi:MAG: hypothetical protein C0425_06410 [Chlorobiaceae bacterium]|nr:hypothetical protein [Chlorobiaceae bacterium]MBA4309953.1 hypothetical protein [Chlorobiaceae bacterium]
MKKYLVIILILFSVNSYSQFRDRDIFQPSIKEGIVNSNSNLIFGFINPNNFVMKHSYNLSYSAWGGNGMAVGAYTNSMFYKIADNFDVQADISLIHSPFNSFGREFGNQFNGIHLTRAQINYKPSDNFLITVQYRQIPFNYFNSYGFHSPYRNYSPFHDFGF